MKCLYCGSNETHWIDQHQFTTYGGDDVCKDKYECGNCGRSFWELCTEHEQAEPEKLDPLRFYPPEQGQPDDDIPDGWLNGDEPPYAWGY